MPDNPTDKKLTFKEWLNEMTNLYIEFLMLGGEHGGMCIGKDGLCRFCELESLLSEYYEGFKTLNHEQS